MYYYVLTTSQVEPFFYSSRLGAFLRDFTRNTYSLQFVHDALRFIALNRVNLAILLKNVLCFSPRMLF